MNKKGGNIDCCIRTLFMSSSETRATMPLARAMSPRVVLCVADGHSQRDAENSCRQNRPSWRKLAESKMRCDMGKQEHGNEGEVAAPIVLGSRRHVLLARVELSEAVYLKKLGGARLQATFCSWLQGVYKVRERANTARHFCNLERDHRKFLKHRLVYRGDQPM